MKSKADGLANLEITDYIEGWLTWNFSPPEMLTLQYILYYPSYPALTPRKITAKYSPKPNFWQILLYGHYLLKISFSSPVRMELCFRIKLVIMSLFASVHVQI